MGLHEWFYRDGRPNRPARILDRITAAIHARGVRPNYLVSLDVRGRHTGRSIRFPLVMVVVEGERYLVSMLGQNTNWVRNVRAAGGEATLCHGRREHVLLKDVASEGRAPILAAYLKRAPNARAHIPVSPDAPLTDFARLATHYPVFRVVATG